MAMAPRIPRETLSPSRLEIKKTESPSPTVSDGMQQTNPMQERAVKRVKAICLHQSFDL